MQKGIYGTANSAREKYTDMQKFSERLRTAMDTRGLTQGELAQGAGLTQASVSRYLNDVTEPKSRELFQIARYLGLKMEALLSDDFPIEEPASVAGWKRRAINAEQKVVMLKSGMEGLLKKI